MDRGGAVSGLPGVDLDALSGWLDHAAPGLRHGPLSGERIAGGMSNLTLRITDGSTTWALRRPPLGHVLPTAHDMAREFRIISALRRTPVPVPHPVVLCEEPEVLGAQFYLMSFVDGVVLDKPETLALLTPETAASACERLIDVLLELHALDPDELGLHDFGRPHGFLERQLRRWAAQWQASQTQERPELDDLWRRLGETRPEQSAAGIVHGDYRLTNVIYTTDVADIAAVVDWEMTTIGDPLADVGLLVVYQDLATQGSFLTPASSAEVGLLDSEALVQRYDAGSPRDLTAIDWYVAFGYVKLAVIAEGIHHRFLEGKTVGDGFDGVGAWVPVLLERAATRLDSLTT
jgi:aminoglycoside phosphotransferase (APT) family kinase protein